VAPLGTDMDAAIRVEASASDMSGDVTAMAAADGDLGRDAGDARREVARLLRPVLGATGARPRRMVSATMKMRRSLRPCPMC
jgi:hypothetical protein